MASGRGNVGQRELWDASMSEVVIGALVGAIIALAGTALAALFAHFRWKRDVDLEIYREERNRLEKDFDEMLTTYRKALKSGGISARWGKV